LCTMSTKFTKNLIYEKDHEQMLQHLKEEIQHLDAENFRLKNLVELFPGDIYWKDKNGVWGGVNKRCAHSLYQMGFIKSPAEMEVIGKTDFQLFNQLIAEEFRQHDLEVMEKKIELTQEETVQLSNGETRTLHFTKRALLDKAGEVIGILGNAVDVSNVKKMEAELSEAKAIAEAASQAKTEFLFNMRHDIRTPLSGIVGFSEILKSESNESHIREYADNLIVSSHALLDFMDDVLEAVRVSSGEVPILKRKFNVWNTLEQVVDLYKARAQEKRLDLTLLLDKKLPHFLIGDKIRMHRIVLELVGNALNFTEAGHVTIHVELAKKQDRQVVIKLSVSDSGMGIPKDKQQEIYIQFKRLVPSYQGIHKGAGLGLYVVKQFIDELGGEIYVTSEVNKGSCFTCLIPMQEALLDDTSGIDNEELSTASNTNSRDAAAESAVSILVVEDSYIAQSVVKSLLTGLSCRVDVASKGDEALALYQKNTYDLLFLDIGLGDGIDGYEVTRRLRKRTDSTKWVPIIALTAHNAEDQKQRCIAAGMDAMLIKPLTQADAVEVLKTFVPHRKNNTETRHIVQYDLPDTEEELFQLDQFALLDYDQALKSCGSITLLTEMLTGLIPNISMDLECMKEAYHRNDYPLVEQLAHKIKGDAMYLGTTRMRYACQYLERYWKSGKREQFDKLYYQTIGIIKLSCNFVNAWLENQKKSRKRGEGVA
jgi:two-component system aerobic respiration control sensor histidine kinase ArcB